MIIKNNLSYIYISILWIAMIISVIVFASLFGFIFPILICFFYMLYLCVCSTVVFGRKIIFNEDGAIICFLWFKKMYLWSDLNVKIDNCGDKLAIRGTTHKRALYISPHIIPDSIFCHPNFWSTFVHPFSFVFIYLLEDDVIDGGLLQMSEAKFKEQMEAWGKIDLIKEK